MNLRERIRSLILPSFDRKASGSGPAISAFNLGQPYWTPRNYEQLAREAYTLNAIAFRCVKLVSQMSAGVRMLLVDGENEIETHPVLDLLSRPGAMRSGKEVFEAHFAYEMLAGNSYLEAVGNQKTGALIRGRPPTELWNLRPDRVKVVVGPYGLPSGFTYEANGVTKRWDVNPINATGPILHVKDFHPTNDWYGLPRVDPAAYAIDRHNAGSAVNKALLDNGVRPSGVLIFKPIKVQGGEVVQTPASVIQEAEARLKDRSGGAANSGKPLVIGGDADWQQMGLSAVDMQFEEGMNSAGRDICTAFGVPHILIVTGSATYNNIREAKLELAEETVMPLVEQLAEKLSAWLLPMFGLPDSAKLIPDWDTLSALELRREIKRGSALKLYNGDLINKDEARGMIEYDAVPDGELFKSEASAKREADKAAAAAKLAPPAPAPNAKPLPFKPRVVKSYGERKLKGVRFERQFVRKSVESYTDKLTGVLEAQWAAIKTRLRADLKNRVFASADVANRVQALLEEILLDRLDDAGRFTSDIEAVARDSAHEAMRQAFGTAEIRTSLFDQVNAAAVEYARERAAELVGKRITAGGTLIDNPDARYSITATTRRMLHDMIVAGLDENIGHDAIVDRIEASGMFSRARAEMIARTEIATANSFGALGGYRTARDNGVQLRKEWMLGHNPCFACIGNAEAGPIDLDARFPSGHLAPSAHPMCQCAISGVVIEPDQPAA